MSSPYTPFLILGGMSYANNWLTTHSVTDFKPLLAGGIAAMFAGFAGAVSPDAAKVVTAIGWIAVAGYFVLPGGPGATLLGQLNSITTTPKKV